MFGTFRPIGLKMKTLGGIYNVGKVKTRTADEDTSADAGMNTHGAMNTDDNMSTGRRYKMKTRSANCNSCRS